MFTGLIEQTGTIRALEQKPGARRLIVAAPGIVSRLKEGDSIAVNGVCLTALAIGGDTFAADLAQETVERTSLTGLRPEPVVNLELPTPAGTPLGGHIVQGHVDATGQMVSMQAVSADAAVSETDWWLTVEVPPAVARYVVEKGSIAIEGISLTVARWNGREATIAVIPHTYARTNLHTLKPGDPVNLEADVIMKFAEQRSAARETEDGFALTAGYLVEHGY